MWEEEVCSARIDPDVRFDVGDTLIAGIFLPYVAHISVGLSARCCRRRDGFGYDKRFVSRGLPEAADQYSRIL